MIHLPVVLARISPSRGELTLDYRLENRNERRSPIRPQKDDADSEETDRSGNSTVSTCSLFSVLLPSQSENFSTLPLESPFSPLG